MQQRRILTALAVTAIVVAACSGGSTPAPSSVPSSQLPASQAPASQPASAAGTERHASVARPDGRRPQPHRLGGYVVGGTGGEQVQGYDWVTPFETATGCKVTVKVGLDSANMVQLMKTGQYDGVSASGDATLRLIAGGDVSPVNFDLIPNYEDVFDGLKNQPYNTVNGVGYGVPHGRGANVLMYDPTVVTTKPDSWSVVFDASSPYKGKVTAYNYAIYVADAALYLMATKPDLGIKNPYALDETQLGGREAAPVQQKTLDRQVLGHRPGGDRRFTNGDMAIGSAWQYQVNINAAGGKKVEFVKPKEGATGWSDTWMISSKAEAPELHVQVDGLHHLAEGERAT